jgi:hypothetical protein
MPGLISIVNKYDIKKKRKITVSKILTTKKLGLNKNINSIRYAKVEVVITQIL